MKFHKGVKSVMLNKDVKAVDLARILGISCRSVFNQIGEGANPTLQTQIKYANALDVPLSRIILEAERFA